ncbi:serine/threonine-protein kinase [Schaalia suimastitidis]|uniref:serine/threonine-protein kinase n=1 Tax=Schaalia suimastitidis TaxID=121163 RepID=UPI0004110F99|nr:serine/threonine-protein kinase [Schaalia suimastitidis]
MGEHRSKPPKIPTFEWVRDLGSGGFADVFLYKQSVPERMVAIKVLRTTGNEQLDAAFRAEVNLMARMSAHPAVVSVFGAGVTDDGRQYLVMEYCPPPTVAQRARQQPYSVHRVLDMGVRLAGAVASLHREGILHRDIKPSNILLTEFGHPVLADFGLAASFHDGTISAGRGFSVPWAPPEQQNGSGDLDTTVDVYSLAATLHTMLTGHSPFELPGGDNSELSMILRTLRLPVPPTGRTDVPPQLERVLSIAMSKDPRQRYASVVEFARSLQQIQVDLRQRMTPIDVLSDEELFERDDSDFPETRRPVIILSDEAPERTQENDSKVENSVRRSRPLSDSRGMRAQAARERQKTRQRASIVATVLFVFFVALGCVVALLWANRHWFAPTTPTEEELQVPEISVPVSPQSVITGLSGEIEGDKVRFTWDPAYEGATYLYQVLDPVVLRDVRQTQETSILIDQELGQTCLAVAVATENGTMADSTAACVVTP